jgi:hypothetical protein
MASFYASGENNDIPNFLTFAKGLSSKKDTTANKKEVDKIK